jgi:hypothetical protein
MFRSALSGFFVALTSSPGIINKTNYHTARLSALVTGSDGDGTGSGSSPICAKRVLRQGPFGPGGMVALKRSLGAGRTCFPLRRVPPTVAPTRRNAGQASGFSIKCAIASFPHTRQWRRVAHWVPCGGEVCPGAFIGSKQ